MTLKIEDYALIGNACTAALVAKSGSIDWLCMPRFDSPACFAALLGNEANGNWKIAPAGKILSNQRQYRKDTLVLETTFNTPEGTITLIDLMPIGRHLERPGLLRIVLGHKGNVPVRMTANFRFDYGHVLPLITCRKGMARAIAGPDALTMRAPVHLPSTGSSISADFFVAKGDIIPFTLTYHTSHNRELRPKNLGLAIIETEREWKEWSSQYGGKSRWREPIVRSLITLKALTYAPTGGIVAAATTSLPEHLGGRRNWDYRFCWLRDATFTLYALALAGYSDEACAWREWLIRAIAGEPNKIQIMYGLAGERHLPESAIAWLDGYEGSKPVRVGNAAHRQFQLDVIGEVMDSLYNFQECRPKSPVNGAQILQPLMDFLESGWRRPDEGIWEVRGARRHFTHSKVMAWVAADRAVKMVERHGTPGPIGHWRRLRDTIHAEVLERGYDSKLNSFVQHYGSKTIDASLLLISLVGFLSAKDPRMLGTLKAVERRLMRNGFIARYNTSHSVDGLPPGEGAFLACNFWYVDVLSLLGKHQKARRTFELLLGIRNDVGLLAEQYDINRKRIVGNFPQALYRTWLSSIRRIIFLLLMDQPNGAASPERNDRAFLNPASHYS